MVGLGGAGLEVRIHDHVDERDQELVLVANGRNLMVGIEDFGLVQAEGFHNVLVGVGVNRLFKGLAQQELTTLGGRDVAVSPQGDVVRRQGVGRHKETQVALDDAALVFRKTVGIFPEGDVAVHVHFLRHPVVGTSGQILFPGPLVLERNELVDVGLPIDDALVRRIHATHARSAGLCGGRASRCCRHGGGLNRGKRGGNTSRAVLQNARSQNGLCGLERFVPGQHKKFPVLKL